MLVIGMRHCTTGHAMQAHSIGPNAKSFHPSSWWISFNINQLEEAELADFYWIGRNMLSAILSLVVQQSICIILPWDPGETMS